LIDLYILTGRKEYDSVEKHAAYMKANDPDDGNRASAGYWHRDVAYIHGRITEALRRHEEVFLMEEARGNPIPPLLRPIDSAWAEIWHRKQPARAVERLDAALARPNIRALPVEDRRHLDLATMYSLAGRPDRARAMIAEFQAAVTDTALRRQQEPAYHRALGELALAERRWSDAIREFRMGDRLPDGPRDSCMGCLLNELARSFDGAGMQDSAIAAYERYVVTPESFTWPDEWFLAYAHRRLGELYDAKGDARNAIRHYEKFVYLWRNADPELQPRVAQARQRLAILRGR
jgi:tetratricopeptide (TPR) repeat protein